MPQQNDVRRLEPPSCDDRLMWDIVNSNLYLPTVTVAEELGLFALLNQQPASAPEVAASLSLGARAAEAVLGILTSLGLLVQSQGKFCITESTRNYLLRDSPYYWGRFLHQTRAYTHAEIREAVLKDDLRPNSVQWLAGGMSPE